MILQSRREIFVEPRPLQARQPRAILPSFAIFFVSSERHVVMLRTSASAVNVKLKKMDNMIGMK
jgi:hypothetical protein